MDWLFPREEDFFALFRKQILWGIVLIVVGLLVGPGGVSIFT